MQNNLFSKRIYKKKNDIKEAHEYDLISDKRGASMKFKTQCFSSQPLHSSTAGVHMLIHFIIFTLHSSVLIKIARIRHESTLLISQQSNKSRKAFTLYIMTKASINTNDDQHLEQFIAYWRHTIPTLAVVDWRENSHLQWRCRSRGLLWKANSWNWISSLDTNYPTSKMPHSKSMRHFSINTNFLFNLSNFK